MNTVEYNLKSEHDGKDGFKIEICRRECVCAVTFVLEIGRSVRDETSGVEDRGGVVVLYGERRGSKARECQCTM